jgi:hypothetical protein
MYLPNHIRKDMGSIEALAQTLTHGCSCLKCKEYRHQYYLQHKEQIIERMKSSSLTPEKREARNARRRENYHKKKELKKQQTISAQ